MQLIQIICFKMSWQGAMKAASRICQLKQEESLNVANREAAHERSHTLSIRDLHTVNITV